MGFDFLRVRRWIIPGLFLFDIKSNISVFFISNYEIKMSNDKLHVNKHQIFANGCTIETYHKPISQSDEQIIVFDIFMIDDNSEYVNKQY